MSDTVAAGAQGADAARPLGTVSLVFTDIENSTGHLRELRGGYGRLLADHAQLLREAAAARDGLEVDTQGDAFFFVFRRAIDALRATVDAQRAIAAHGWPGGTRVRVRIGVHTGEPELMDGRYLGLDVHLAARICAAAHGGQVLLSRTSAALVEEELPTGVGLRGVGDVRLRGFDRPQPLVQLDIAGLDAGFPAPRGMGGEEPSPIALVDDVVSAAREFELELLGPLSVRRSGREVPVTAAKHRTILAALALRAGEVVPADVLIDTLWGDHPPATATKALQVYVSELRKLVEADAKRPQVIASQPPGYRLAVNRDAIDLVRFERLWTAGREALADGEPRRAQQLLGECLALWRGEPLADFRYEEGFAGDIRRLEELRVACLEDRIDADLALGEHSRLVPELETLVGAHQLRERLRGQLMLALYRCGRQTDALEAYQDARDQLVGEFGIDPSPPLVALERQILQQDPALAAPLPDQPPMPVSPASPGLRMLMTVSQSAGDVDALTSMAEAIVRADHDRELVLARVVTALPGQDATPRLREATRSLAEQRDLLSERGLRARVAALASRDPAADLLKLAHHLDADLLLVDGSQTLLEGHFGAVDALLKDAACDVALHLARDGTKGEGAVVVPFAGGEHDWAALELAALLCRNGRRPLVLTGVDHSEGGSDSSRLLATASLVIQRVGDVIAEPLLVPPGAAPIIEAAGDGHVITGLSARFREEGLGETRFELARNAPGPVTFMRRGTRPGVLAPPASITRFTWSLNQR